MEEQQQQQQQPQGQQLQQPQEQQLPADMIQMLRKLDSRHEALNQQFQSLRSTVNLEYSAARLSVAAEQAAEPTAGVAAAEGAA